MVKTALSSLKYRIAISVFIMEAIMLTVVLWNTFNFVETQAKEDLDNRHRIVIELIQQISSNSIFSEEYDDLQQYIEQIAQDPEIFNIAILNRSGVIIAHSQFDKVGAKMPEKLPSLHHYWVTKRISKFGFLEIEFSLERLSEQLQKARQLGIGIAMAGMIVIAISGLMFGFLLTHKLGSLTKVISKFKESGEYSYVEISGSDEIATLSRAFNHMGNKINDYIDRIESDKNLLEVRVAERTKELEDAKKKMAEVNSRLESMAVTDHLTGLFNRIKIEESMETEYLRRMRYRTNFSIVLLDIDKFKNVNDVHGHDVGDSTLVTLSKILSDHVRKIDIVGRWGGEEFIIVCPGTDINGAAILAENLRREIEKSEFDTVGTLTCSFGVSEMRDDEMLKELIKRSDVGLYLAKAQGRNRVVRAEDKDLDA